MNALTPVVSGSVSAIGRRLSGPVDPLALYARLSDQGRRPDTALFETTAGKTIIIDRAALRIECRGGRVVLDSLSPTGAPVLRAIRAGMSSYVVSDDEGKLTLEFERSVEVDAQRRLFAPSPFDVLRAIINGFVNRTPEEPMALCLLGVIAFDHVDLFEDLPANAEDPTAFPDFIFWLVESAVIIDPGLAPRLVCSAFDTGDHDDGRRNLNSAVERLRDLAFRSSDIHPYKMHAGSALNVTTDLSDDEFAAVVDTLKEHIRAGDVYQIVASRTFRASCDDPLGAFARVRALDRSPYMFFVAMRECTLFGASPETSVRLLGPDSRTLEVKPIAGTRPRGLDDDEDNRMEADLRLDAKEAAEHMMLVDLARNDVARVSKTGTRHVSHLMSLEKYARVMHLVSSVKGELAPGHDAFHALQACLNVGTLSGAPKLEATKLLRRYERTRRGAYGGAIGWLNGAGALDTGVVIRSALVKDGTAFVRAGAGIVHDSDPLAETDETRRKASAVLSAIAGEQRR